MDTPSAYKQKMAAQLKEWDAQIHLLEAKIATLGVEMRLKGTEELEKLRVKRQLAADKMHELGEATGQVWEEAKAGADRMWADLKASIATLRDKF